MWCCSLDIDGYFVERNLYVFSFFFIKEIFFVFFTGCESRAFDWKYRIIHTKIKIKIVQAFQCLYNSSNKIVTFNNFFRNVNRSWWYFQRSFYQTKNCRRNHPTRNIPEAKIVKKEDFFLPFSIPRFLTFSYHFSLRRSKTKNPEQARSYAHAYKRRRKRRKRRKKKEEEKKKEEKKRKERAACGATSDSPVG